MLDLDINSIKEVLASIQKIQIYLEDIHHKDELVSDSKLTMPSCFNL